MGGGVYILWWRIFERWSLFRANFWRTRLRFSFRHFLFFWIGSWTGRRKSLCFTCRWEGIGRGFYFLIRGLAFRKIGGRILISCFGHAGREWRPSFRNLFAVHGKTFELFLLNYTFIFVWVKKYNSHISDMICEFEYSFN